MAVAQPYSVRELPDKYDKGFLKAELQNIQRAIAVNLATIYDRLPHFDVRDDGADVTGAKDCSVAFQDAADRACEWATAHGGAVLYIGTGQWFKTNETHIWADRVHVLFDGPYATYITFNPTTPKAVFRVQKNDTTQIISQGSFRGGFAITGAGTQQKIGIQRWDASDWPIDGLVTANLTGNSGNVLTPSCAIQDNGREFCDIKHVMAYADRPIWQRANLNTPGQREGADHFRGRRLLLHSLISTEDCWRLDGDCGITNWSAAGLSMSGGTNGLNALPIAGGVGIVLTAKVAEYRYEQPGVSGGYAVRWETAAANLIFESGNDGGAVAPTNGGKYIRNVNKVIDDNVIYTGLGGGTAVALDMDASNNRYIRRNCFADPTSVVNMGLEEIESNPNSDGSPIANSGYWQVATAAVKAPRIGTVNYYAYKGSIAAGATVNLPAFSTSLVGMKVCNLQVSGTSAVGPIIQSGVVCDTPNGAQLVTGTIAVGSTPGTLSFIHGATSSILNNTAQTLDYVVSATWN